MGRDRRYGLVSARLSRAQLTVTPGMVGLMAGILALSSLGPAVAQGEFSAGNHSALGKPPTAQAPTATQIHVPPAAIVIQHPALSISAAPNAVTPTADDQITYSLIVRNQGTGVAANVAVSVAKNGLPQRSSGSGDCASVPCTIAQIEPHGQRTITVTQPAAGGGFILTARAAILSKAQAPSQASQTTISVASGPRAAADVFLSPSQTSVAAGLGDQSVSYTLYVGNNGPNVATNVRVQIVGPDQRASVSGACTALPCTIGAIAPKVTQAIRFTQPVASGGSTVVVQARAPLFDPVPQNNTATFKIAPPPPAAPAGADVYVFPLQDTVTPKSADQPISYTVFVSNRGPGTATNVRVSASINGQDQSLSASGACSSVPCMIAAIGAGQNEPIRITQTPGASDLTVSVRASAAQPDPSPQNNIARVRIAAPVAPAADVSVTAPQSSVAPEPAGQPASFTFNIGNNGPATATNVRVSASVSGKTQLSVSGACDALPCVIPSIAPTDKPVIRVSGPESATAYAVTVKAEADQTDPSPQNNATTVSVAAPPPPPPPPNPTTQTTTPPPKTQRPAADLQIVAQAMPQSWLQLGRSADFTVTVGNKGPDAASNVEVDWGDVIPNAVVSGGCAAVPCMIGRLEPAQSRQVKIHAPVGARGGLLAEVSVRNTGPERDMDQANNRAPLFAAPPPWWLPLAELAGPALVLTGLCVLAWRQWRYRQLLKVWLGRLTVTAKLGALPDPHPGPVPFRAPPLGVTVSCGLGNGGPKSAVPVLDVRRAEEVDS